MVSFCSFFRCFLNDRSGNFAVLTALLMPILLVGVAFAFNFARIMITQTELQKATDKTALDLSEFYGNNPNKSPEIIRQMALKQLADLLGVPIEDVQKTIVFITDTIIDGSSYKKVEIKLSLDQLDGLLYLLPGSTNTSLATSSTAIANIGQEGGYSASSIFFVVDQSGSMGWRTDGKYPQPTKMEALKSALDILIKEFEKKILNEKMTLKSNIVSFSDVVYKSPPGEFFGGHLVGVYDAALPLYDGFGHVSQIIERLKPAGGTHLGPAVDVATKALKNEAKMSKDTYKPSRNLIIVSDGANYYPFHDESTVKSCEVAKKDGIIVSAIFFRTGGAATDDNERGERVLRRCVSAPENYVSANTAVELLTALQLIGTIAIKSKPRLIQ